ncbi:glycoside hydrolase family 3 C-terminal domain-containing protein [Alsobacter sp. SYSU M60028]|uniref:beta-glucosidase n=1 Tax=Alsobacter ponti TaxID=2962936 RepID=A0ABT1L722_9HYPH|nr:glycoside hydrolase family 3 N-terminal domain-containing protein [Alsobacter ponti]MCP8937242.1 glycoside hydrolase family 3 C-terminal domain-containing protein [Alsobacter ponti]
MTRFRPQTSMRRLAQAGTAALAILAGAGAGQAQDGRKKIDDLIARMTLEEKVGQLNLLSGHHATTGPYARSDVRAAVLKGQAGALFNVYGAEYTRSLQEMAVTQTRLGIPLLLGFDVLHGYGSIFPVPLAQAATWDLEAIEQAERISAREAASAGVNWIYAPMVDVTRDPRWGRVVEGAGESTWLGARIAAARVKGLQGDKLSNPESVAACVKHFAGNGATEAGRDYTASDLSERAMRETQLPPFKASVDAGARCFMSAFNAVDGVPGVANDRLLKDLLRDEWGFRGIVVSDFGAIRELTVHGVAETPEEAGRMAFRAGTDMDMESRTYVEALPGMVRDGLVLQGELDNAVRRVLQLKMDLGLFDDPYGRSDASREKQTVGRADHLQAARVMAEKSLVLLKNANETLPFSTSLKRVAVIGPLGDAPADTLGPWAANGKPDEAVTLLAGVRTVLGSEAEVSFATGGTVDRSSPADIAAALKVAKAADAVILALGERATQSGEAASRSVIDLPGDQLALARAVIALGRPTATVLFNGRPLTIEDLDREAPAILEAWYPGSEGGLAVARALFGLAEPQGRLPITFPRSVGQIPIYHDARPTGRPAVEQGRPYTASYLDQSPDPLYPFGYGLTYTSFAYGPPRLDNPALGPSGSATVSVDVMNTGKRSGTAQVQLYIRYKVARVSRPIRELKGFGRITLPPGGVGVVKMPLTERDLAFWQPDGRFAPPDSAVVEVLAGPDAATLKSTLLTYRPRGQAAASGRGGG